MLLSHVLSIINSDWLQHAQSVREVYEGNLFSLSGISGINKFVTF